MKFSVNTKPLISAIDLGVINSNISPYHKKSTVIQITISDNIVFNIESEAIKSEIVMKGNKEGEGEGTTFVDSSLFKQLVGTFESDVTEFEMLEGGVLIKNGKSKFTLPKVIDESDISLNKPSNIDDTCVDIQFDKDVWRFIHDNQMYAISQSFIYPIYRYVWMSDSKSIVGDFDDSLFTYSDVSNVLDTCLLTDTIINLLCSIPDDSKVYKHGRNYIIKCESDSFEYTTEFEPHYEGDEGLDSYNSEVFIEAMNHDDKEGPAVDAELLSKFMSQASLLSNGSDSKLTWTYADNIVNLHDNNTDCNIACTGESDIDEFEINFNTEQLRRVLSNYDEGSIHIYPVVQDDKVSGMLVWNDDITTIIAGVE